MQFSEHITSYGYTVRFIAILNLHHKVKFSDILYAYFVVMEMCGILSTAFIPL